MVARRLFHRGVQASLVTACGLLPSCGTRALECVSRWDLSSLIRDPACVPYIGRWNLDHWPTREVPTTWSYSPKNTFWPSSCVSTYWSTLFIVSEGLHKIPDTVVPQFFGTWCWERLRARGEEGGDRGWDAWMASPIQWAWVWPNSGRQWRTGKPGVLQFMELQRVGYNLTTDNNNLFTIIPFLHIFVTSDFLCLLQRCCCVNALAHLCLCAGVKTHLG